MPPVHTELVRRAIRIVCEMVIAELREVLLQKKRKLLEMKSKKTTPAARRKIGRPAPQPINFVNVEGMNADEGVSEGHTEPQTDPWANITIKEEVQDDELTFEEHFDNMDVKTEVKEEMSYETTFAGELNLEASSSGSVKLEDEDNEQEEEPAAKKRKKGAVARDTGTSQEPSASSSFQSVFADQTEKPYLPEGSPTPLI